jgi:hypothetical protein
VCAGSSTAASHELLACLFEARDEIDEATRELLDDDAELSLAGLVVLNVTLGTCKR